MTENSHEDTTQQLYLIADELRAIANYGLMHTSSPYDIERYEKVLDASARLISIIENRPSGDVVADYKGNMNHVSPVVGAEAAVFKNGKILLMKRHDNGLWAVPGGLVDVGETLTSAALRELKEESGLDGKVNRLLGIFDSRVWRSRAKLHLYAVVFEVSVEKGVPVKTKEATDWRYFSADNLPELAPGHHLRVPFLFKLMDGSMETPYFDEPDRLE